MRVDIETGVPAARVTTLMNVSRALGLEVMLRSPPSWRRCVRRTTTICPPLLPSPIKAKVMAQAPLAPQATQSLDLSLKCAEVGVIVRKPGDLHA